MNSLSILQMVWFKLQVLMHAHNSNGESLGLVNINCELYSIYVFGDNKN